jgi:ABC-type multidrug transport system fused ATPase/permease subunit
MYFSNQPLPGFLSHLFSVSDLDGKKHLLYACVGIMIAIGVINFVLTLAVFNLTVSMAQRLVFDLMTDFFAKLQRLSLSFYSRHKIGDLLYRMSSDVFVVYFLVAQIILPALTSLVCLGGMFYIMSQIDLVLAIVAFSVIPLLTILFAFFAKPMNDTTTLQHNTQGLFSAFLQQSLSSMKIIQAFSRESYMQQKLRIHASEFSNAYIMANKVSMTFNQLSVLITAIASAILIVLGSLRGLTGSLSIGDIFIFIGYLTALYGPINSLAMAVGATAAISARGQRVFDVLDSDDVVKEKPHAQEVKNPKGEIEFRNVTFGYGMRCRNRCSGTFPSKCFPGRWWPL